MTNHGHRWGANCGAIFLYVNILTRANQLMQFGRCDVEGLKNGCPSKSQKDTAAS